MQPDSCYNCGNKNAIQKETKLDFIDDILIEKVTFECPFCHKKWYGIWRYKCDLFDVICSPLAK